MLADKECICYYMFNLRNAGCGVGEENQYEQVVDKER